MKERNTNVVAAYLILQREDEILLLKRMNTWYHDWEYSVIAGHVEHGETFTKTIIREAEEEAGILIKPEHLVFRHIVHMKSDTNDSERVHIYFSSTTWEWEVINNEPQKHGELSWFKLWYLPDNIVPTDKKVLENIRNNVMYSEFGR